MKKSVIRDVVKWIFDVLDDGTVVNLGQDNLVHKTKILYLQVVIFNQGLIISVVISICFKSTDLFERDVFF